MWGGCLGPLADGLTLLLSIQLVIMVINLSAICPVVLMRNIPSAVLERGGFSMDYVEEREDTTLSGHFNKNTYSVA